MESSDTKSTLPGTELRVIPFFEPRCCLEPGYDVNIRGTRGILEPGYDVNIRGKRGILEPGYDVNIRGTRGILEPG